MRSAFFGSLSLNNIKSKNKMAYKNKYLVFRTKPVRVGSSFTDTFAQVNVSNLNKKGINQKWDELIEKYPSDKFLSSLTETNNDLREFQDDPLRFSQADA